MNTSTLCQIAQFKGLTQSDIGKAAGISRQAVSLWFKHPNKFVPVSSLNLLNLSRNLGVTADTLLNEIEDEDWWERETANLLWDSLYENLPSFLASLSKGHPRAMARLVEVYGLFSSAKIVGSQAFDEFNAYKHFLPPVRRKELQNLWNMLKDHQLI